MQSNYRQQTPNTEWNSHPQSFIFQHKTFCDTSLSQAKEQTKHSFLIFITIFPSNTSIHLFLKIKILLLQYLWFTNQTWEEEWLHPSKQNSVYSLSLNEIQLDYEYLTAKRFQLLSILFLWSLEFRERWCQSNTKKKKTQTNFQTLSHSKQHKKRTKKILTRTNRHANWYTIYKINEINNKLQI